MTTLERDDWIGMRANWLQLHGPDEFPRGYYEFVATQEWDEDHQGADMTKTLTLTDPVVLEALQHRMRTGGWEFQYTADDGSLVYTQDFSHIGYTGVLVAEVRVDR